ncbi:MAG: response regulator transcription factor [Alistipes sp.]|nr:response regulator transcription factor [Alistipes sp.]
MKQLRIAMAVGSPVVAEGLRSIIDSCGDLAVVLSVDSLHALIDRITAIAPDAVIISTELCPTDAGDIKSAFPELSDMTLMAVQSTLCSDETLRRFDSSISIFNSAEQIARRIREAVDRPAANNYADSHDLTERERDVLVLVAKGHTNKEIASMLNISPHTVISHRKNIAHKTGIRSVAGLTVYAILNHLIDGDIE